MKIKFYILIILLIIILTSLSCYYISDKFKKEPIKLSTEDKIEEVKYLFDFIRKNYPFDDAVVKYKGLESIYCDEYEYIKKVGETKNNEEYINVIAEIIQRLQQGSAHNIIAEPQQFPINNDTAKFCFEYNLSLESIRLCKYWWELLNIGKKYSHSDIDIYYHDCNYIVYNDILIKNILIHKGAKITKINGLLIDDYVKKLQNIIWLRFDSDLQKAYSFNPSPFITYGNNSKKYWIVEFQETDNKYVTCEIIKRKGFKLPRQYPESNSNVLCMELTPAIAYLRLSKFPDISQLKADLNNLTAFFEKSHGTYRKLIIDIRRNSGGSPVYGEELLVKPFIKEPKVYTQYSVVKKDAYTKIEYELARIHGKNKQYNPNLNFGEIKKISFSELPDAIKKCNTEDTSFQYLRTIKKITPENTYDFNGDIVMLIDNDSFSAAEDIAKTYKELKIGKIAGSNSCGGVAIIYPPFHCELPKSHIIIRIEFDMAYNPDGTINEIFGTRPDIELETSIYPTSFPDDYSKESLLKDSWIKRIINEY